MNEEYRMVSISRNTQLATLGHMARALEVILWRLVARLWEGCVAFGGRAGVKVGIVQTGSYVELET